MSAEPARRPEDEDEPTQSYESADEAIRSSEEPGEGSPDPNDASEPESVSETAIDPETAQTEPLTPEAAAEAEAAADAEAAATTDDGDPAASDTTAADDQVGVAAAAAADATATPDTSSAGDAPTADSVTTPAAKPEAEKAAAHRRAVFLAGLGRALGIAFGIALFAVGIAFGMNFAQANRPVPVVVDPIDGPASPPPVAQEFIHSLASNDMDALRSSLDAQPHRDITTELQRFNIQRIERVETLKTQVDGDRSATEIMLITENTDGSPFTINLVILVDGGKIEGFR